MRCDVPTFLRRRRSWTLLQVIPCKYQTLPTLLLRLISWKGDPEAWIICTSKPVVLVRVKAGQLTRGQIQLWRVLTRTVDMRLGLVFDKLLDSYTSMELFIANFYSAVDKKESLNEFLLFVKETERKNCTSSARLKQPKKILDQSTDQSHSTAQQACEVEVGETHPGSA